MAELTEVAEEVVEEVVINAVSQRDVGLVIGGIAIGWAIGFTAGYLIMRKRVESKTDAIIDKMVQAEVADMRAHYEAKARAPKPEIDAVMVELGYLPEEQEAIDEVADEEESAVIIEEMSQNVFGTPKEDVWNYAEELKSRRDDVPYVIHQDEFMQNELEYEQTTLSYFEEDDVLINSTDEIVEDMDELICLDSLSQFGHGTSDPNIVYVRNVELNMEFEIIYSNGSYANEVHGLKHSDEPRRRGRLRYDDE